MRVAILDDIHHAYEGTIGVRRHRERAEVQIFTEPFREPSAIANFDALVANRERTRFSRAFLEQLRICASSRRLAITFTTLTLRQPRSGASSLPRRRAVAARAPPSLRLG